MTTEQRISPEHFIEEQVALLSVGDTAGLSLRYAEDAVFIRLDHIARGRQEIKEFFDDYIAQHPRLFDLDGVAITEDVLVYQVPERIGDKLQTAVGTIVFKDGLVWRQTAVFVPDRSPDSVPSA